MSRTAPTLSEPSTQTSDDLTHFYCCNPNVAWCGTDITEYDEDDEDDDALICVVCEDLGYFPCERCGDGA